MPSGARGWWRISRTSASGRSSAKARYSDPAASEYIAKTLIARRDKVLKAWLAGVNPVVDPALTADGVFTFRNAAVDAGVAPAASAYVLPGRRLTTRRAAAVGTAQETRVTSPRRRPRPRSLKGAISSRWWSEPCIATTHRGTPRSRFLPQNRPGLAACGSRHGKSVIFLYTDGPNRPVSRLTAKSRMIRPLRSCCLCTSLSVAILTGAVGPAAAQTASPVPIPGVPGVEQHPYRYGYGLQAPCEQGVRHVVDRWGWPAR